MNKRIKLLIAVTIPESLGFYRGQIDFLKNRGFEIEIVCSPGDQLNEFAIEYAVPVHEISLKRNVSLISDLLALIQIFRLVRKIRPEIVHGSTPKAALLSMLAAFMARVPVRFYTIRGLPREAYSGSTMYGLLFLEWLTYLLATRVLVNSSSTLSILSRFPGFNLEKVSMLNKGSSNGVESCRSFNPTSVDTRRVTEIKEALGIGRDQIVIGFVGRLAVSKGIRELGEAWATVREKFPSAVLMIIGSRDSREPVTEDVLNVFQTDKRVCMVGVISNNNMPSHYATMDVLVLPTYREGLPNVVLEASAMELPVVATKVTGCVDAVLDGVTGTLVRAKDGPALAEGIINYLENPLIRKKHGKAGREWMIRDFKPEDVWEALYVEYAKQLLTKRSSRILPKYQVIKN